MARRALAILSDILSDISMEYTCNRDIGQYPCRDDKMSQCNSWTIDIGHCANPDKTHMPHMLINAVPNFCSHNFCDFLSDLCDLSF